MVSLAFYAKCLSRDDKKNNDIIFWLESTVGESAWIDGDGGSIRRGSKE